MNCQKGNSKKVFYIGDYLPIVCATASKSASE